MRERYVVVTSCVCAWWTELKTNEREALGGDITELNVNILFVSVRRSYKAELNTRIMLLECLGGV